MNQTPEEIFRAAGSRLRMSEAISKGISRYMLYKLLKAGVIERVSRGIYQLTDLPPMRNPDLATVALRFPDAVVCLISALSFHDLTTQVPHEVSVAVPRTARIPQLNYPPLRVHRFSRQAYETGIEDHQLDGVRVKIYSREKTIVDSFKFRNRIGMDVTLEALKLYQQRGNAAFESILGYARICRVENVIRPYLEAIM